MKKKISIIEQSEQNIHGGSNKSETLSILSALNK